MNTFAVVFLCFQACLVQTVVSQCTSRAAVADLAGPYGLAGPALPGSYGFAGAGLTGPYGLNTPLAAPGLAAPYGLGAPALAYDGFGYPAAGLAPYGGAGEGNVAVAGELPVAGTTAVAGQVPIMGAVRFEGPVAAAGTVTIAGNCACGCGAPYEYLY